MKSCYVGLNHSLIFSCYNDLKNGSMETSYVTLINWEVQLNI